MRLKVVWSHVKPHQGRRQDTHDARLHHRNAHKEERGERDAGAVRQHDASDTSESRNLLHQVGYLRHMVFSSDCMVVSDTYYDKSAHEIWVHGTRLLLSKLSVVLITKVTGSDNFVICAIIMKNGIVGSL